MINIRSKRFLNLLKNKYVLAVVILTVWMLFFDQNNLIDRVVNMRKYQQLKKDKEYYQTKIEEDRKKLLELRTNRENLEKFAREQYLMKKDNEDIFVIEE